MSSYVVTGSSRGIGLELVKQLLELPKEDVSTVFAISRRKAQGLDDLIASSDGRLVNIMVEDFASSADVQNAVDKIGSTLGGGLDVLVNNAGMMPYSPGNVDTMSAQSLIEVFNTNVVTAQVVTACFLPLLRKGKQKKVINISTTLGSIARVDQYVFAPAHAYKVSKAAMNMLNALYALDYGKDGFTFLAISPGWLKTDLGSQNADLDVATGVNSVKNIILKADSTSNGKFVNIHVAGWENVDGPNQYEGKEIPW